MPDKKGVHDWLQSAHVALVPGPATHLLESFAAGLLDAFRALGHDVQAKPNKATNLILTFARVGKPISWREALSFTIRRRWKLRHTPTVFTLMHTTPEKLQSLLERFDAALAKDPPDPADFDFPGLASQAYHTLVEQGRRGGSLLNVLRLLQAQTKCIRIVLAVGKERLLGLYLFDLVGAHPWIDAGDPEYLYRDVALRMITCISTHEVTSHETVGEPIARSCWDTLSTPADMTEASRELGKRHFFTEMVRVSDLVKAPALDGAIKSQYSEGCFATWDPVLGALVATVTGSARPVEKENVTEDDLAVIVGIRPDGRGVLIRHVEGKHNDPPSSEAVEMMEMDRVLPRLSLGKEWGAARGTEAPVIRSKLHGHRSVSAYDPRWVEHVCLDQTFHDYPVSCGSDAQARAIRDAFSRSRVLQSRDDPRQVVFTILPGHGTVIAEKWVPGKAPFQSIWECMDAGHLEVAPRIPQGRYAFVPGPDGRHVLVNGEDGTAASRDRERA